MASLSRDDSGRVTIQFIHPTDKKRRTIRAGKMSERAGEGLKRKVEDLAAALSANQPLDQETQRWLVGIGDDLRDKLAAVGLADSIGTAKLGAFLDAYIETRTDAAPNTLINLRMAAGYLTERFGANKDLRSITEADADRFLQSMLTDYAPATVSRGVRRAQQFFRHAVRSRILTENPFAGLKLPSQVNRKRMFFLTLEDAAKVRDACPDVQWRTLFALTRFGGLRCPSEVMLLTWQDVDWERGRLRIQAPKTKRYEGKEERVIPLFPELREALEEAFEAAVPGALHIVHLCSDPTVNLRTQFHRIIRRAGLTPWPRTFQNLRATRETELAAVYPVHVVTAWMGHEALVAQKHYLSVTDADYESAAKSAALALQKQVQQGTAPTRKESQPSPEVLASCGYVPDDATGCGTVQVGGIPPGGIEPPPGI
jgi:integrase